MLVSLKDILEDARKNHYAVPAFDISNFEMMKAVLETCEEEHSPAILMALGCDLTGKNLALLPAMVKEAAKHFSIPVCLHLDHATDLEFIKSACGYGFSSVMFDGSALPFDENAAKTAEVVSFAHKNGITVEAELGRVGNAMVGNEADSVENEDPEDTLTLPEEVTKFVEITDVDALAVAIGTAHGVYKKTPTLRIDRLDEITAASNIPLVLHGGSGTPDDQMTTAIRHGITKINIFSDVVGALNAGLKQKLNTITNPSTWPVFVFEDARAMMKDVVRGKLNTFGSANRI